MSKFLILLVFFFFWRTASAISKERVKNTRQQAPKAGDAEEGGMLGWVLKWEAQLPQALFALLLTNRGTVGMVKTHHLYLKY